MIYEIEEPILNQAEFAYKEQIKEILRDMINTEKIVENQHEMLLKYIDERLKFLAVEFGLNISYESYKERL